MNVFPMDGYVWLAANPVGHCMAAVSQPWAAMNSLNVKIFRAENGGVLRGTYLNAYIWKCPGGGGGGLHLHINCPVRATPVFFCEMEWDLTTLWQIIYQVYVAFN